MAKKKRFSNAFGTAGLALPLAFVMRHRQLVLLAFLLGGLVIGARMLWNRLGPAILEGPDYLVTTECIEINPPPEWVQSDIVGEAVLNGSLEGLNITEDRLTVKVADAFALHPWVEKVVGVEKHFPARIEVELQYRRPVAMVEVTIDGRPGLLPVDRGGILLPPEDFAPEAATHYPRINVGLSMPAGPVGTPWGDGKVAGAAKIADLLRDHWQPLGLTRIVVEAESEAPGLRLPSAYVISATNGSQVLWGHAPGQESSQEAAASTKLERLLDHAKRVGQLADSPPQQIDLREAASLEVTPQTAAVPVAAPE